MKEITLRIDGGEVKGKEGETVLDVCLANGICVPTLCNMKGLTPVGACRLCAIEVEGENKLNTACTYPARDGLVVRINTEELNNYRRRMLEFLFAERNHYCMFCEKSGDCELQSLAYRFQLYSNQLTMFNPKLPVDPSNRYFAIDHNRCVLCGRCIRACDEIVGLHVLDFSERGAKTLVTAGSKEPLEKSACIGCGLCVQVCPTGAIFDKTSSYKFNRLDCQKIATTCEECGLGCPINIFVKDGKPVRIEGPDLEDPRVQLCKAGRFDILYNDHRRISKPMIRENGELKERPMEEVLDFIVKRISSLKDRPSILCLASGMYSNDTLELFKRFATETLRTPHVDTTDGYWYKTATKSLQGLGEDVECSLEDISKADCLLLIGLRFEVQNPIHSLIRKAVQSNAADLIVISSIQNSFRDMSHVWLKPRFAGEDILLEAISKAIKGDEVDLEETARESHEKLENLQLVIKMVNAAKRCIMIYGEDLIRLGGSRAVASIYEIATRKGKIDGRIPVTSIKPRSNNSRAWHLRLRSAPGFGRLDRRVRVAYLMLGDEPFDPYLITSPEKPDLLIVHGTYRSPITSMAHVVIPATTWLERSGHYDPVTGERRIGSILEKPASIKDEKTVITELSMRLGGPIGFATPEIRTRGDLKK